MVYISKAVSIFIWKYNPEGEPWQLIISFILGRRKANSLGSKMEKMHSFPILCCLRHSQFYYHCLKKIPAMITTERQCLKCLRIQVLFLSPRRAKGSASNVSFNLFFYAGWQVWSSERWGNLSKVTVHVSSRASKVVSKLMIYNILYNQDTSGSEEALLFTTAPGNQVSTGSMTQDGFGSKFSHMLS